MLLFSWLKRTKRWLATIFTASTVPRLPRDQIVDALDQIIAHSQNEHYQAAVLILQIDDFGRLERAVQDDVLAHIITETENRLIDGPCRRDMVRRLSEGKFAVIPTPLAPTRINKLRNLAEAIQTVITQEILAEYDVCYLSMSVGFASQAQLHAPTGSQLLDAARFAERSATLQGPGSIQAFDADLQKACWRAGTNANPLAAHLKAGRSIRFSNLRFHLKPGM